MSLSNCPQVCRRFPTIDNKPDIFAAMKNWLLLFGGFWLANIHVSGQTIEKLSLKQSIDKALNQNLDIQLAHIAEQSAEIDYNQSLWAMSPDLNGIAGQFYQSGRSIDRFSNQYVQTTIGSNNFQLQSNWTLFAGGQIREAIKQNKFLQSASRFDKLQAQQSVALNVALGYLQCLQNKEQAKALKANITAQEQEVIRVDKLWKAGSSTEAQFWSAKSQLANQLSQYTQANNQYILALNSFKNLLLLPYETQVELLEFQGDLDSIHEQKYDFKTLADSVMAHRPDVLAAQMRVKASEHSVSSAKGALLPTINLGGSLNSVYSDNAKSATISGVVYKPVGRVQSTQEIVEAPVATYQTQTIKFNKQLKDNFGQSFGATMSIPIFGKFQVQNQIRKAELGWLRNKINLEKTEQTVKNDVSTALINYSNSINKFKAMREAHRAQKKNLEFVQLRFQAGQAGQFELQNAQQLEIAAFQNLISAKYETYFRQIILDIMLNGISTLK